MRPLTIITLCFVLTYTAAFTAYSQDEVAPALVNIKVTEVGRTGHIIITHHPFPEDTVFIGIPAKVSTESACIFFAGQETRKKQSFDKIMVKGTTDPLPHACIEIYPLPVDTVLTLAISTLDATTGSTGETIIERMVKIGRNMYKVVVNLDNYIVSINPV